MKGAILKKRMCSMRMSSVFNAIHNIQNEYNWLISGRSGVEKYKDDYIWLTGEELTDIIKREEDFYWFFAVLSGFPKEITKEQVLQYDYPYADGYRGFFNNPITIQHPMAVIEIVSYDASYVLVISKIDKIVEDFIVSMPFPEDLETHNNRMKGLSSANTYIIIVEQLKASLNDTPPGMRRGAGLLVISPVRNSSCIAPVEYSGHASYTQNLHLYQGTAGVEYAIDTISLPQQLRFDYGFRI